MNTLSIHTQRAAIEIVTRPAKMVVQQNEPRFDMRREPPSMRVVSEMPRFTRNEEYVKPQPPVNAAGAEAVPIAQEAAGARYEAAAMGAEESPVSVTVRDSPDMNVGLRSRDKARLEWEPGYCTIEWTDPVLQIEWNDDFRPAIEWEPYAVEVRLSQRPLVLIRVNLENIPGNAGIRIDQRI